MVLRSDGNGSWIIKRTHALLVFILLIVSATTAIVTTFGITPIQEKIYSLDENDKCQDIKINANTTNILLIQNSMKLQNESILKELDRLNQNLEKLSR